MKIEKLNKSYYVKTDNDKIIGSFQFDTDGSYYFYHNSELTGCWTSHSLREIAALLDEVNKPFDDTVDEYFIQERRDFENLAWKEYKQKKKEIAKKTRRIK
jgi:hypothetical protein